MLQIRPLGASGPAVAAGERYGTADMPDLAK
jgi:hypothetical protein